MRTKALTVVIAMVTTFAILPTFGAAAAEPLDDGSYEVPVGESTYTVEVVEGTPVVADAEDVEFTFAFDEETGRVLDEFDVTVDGSTYDVDVAEDGTVSVTRDEGSEDGTDDTDGEGDGTDGTDDTDGAGDDTDGAGDDTDGEGDDTDGDEDLDDEEGDEPEEDLEDGDDDEADGAHGELVSTVAKCTPNGWVARNAGLPNQGYFVSAAARGETVEFEVDGETLTADLTSMAGVEEFCALAAELVDDADEESEDAGNEAASEPGTAEVDDEDGDDEVRGNGKGRSGAAPGRSGDAPGRSGNAPGRAKKGR